MVGTCHPKASETSVVLCTVGWVPYRTYLLRFTVGMGMMGR